MEKEENELDKPKGLYNLGLSCYMNSLLQCFYHIPELREYFIENIDNFTEKPLCNALAEVMIDLKFNDIKIISPKNFRNEIRKINKLFLEDKACDVKDLFINLVDCLIEELKTQNENEINENNDDDNDLFNKEKLFLNLKEEVDKNIINKLFGGYYLTTIKCEETKTEFYAIQNEAFLLFDLIKIYKEKKELTFSSCFDYFLKPKISSYYCPTCKKAHNAKATESIYKPPKILAIVLERGKSKKFKEKFQFKSEVLELEKIIEKNYPYYKTLYQLIAVSTHSGSSSSSGHYTACCLAKNGKYYYFNDSVVKEISLEELYENDPYILFYVRTEGKNNKNKDNETQRGDDIKIIKEIKDIDNKKDKFKHYINFFIKNPNKYYSIDYYNQIINDEELNPLIWRLIIKGENKKCYIFKLDFTKNYYNDLTQTTTLETNIDHLNFKNSSLLFKWEYKEERNTLENIYIYIKFIYNLIKKPDVELLEKFLKEKEEKYNEVKKN